ncbi:ATP-binding protein [Metabacillus herbersteinensis]|uniref:histidine kinase n=1 Tax=Metabacillus herbersteinensis TaxID=283816 RepID=A0ABV6GBM4_9BACI
MARLKRFWAWVTSFSFTRKHVKTPLLYHWTKRYLITLVIGLIIIGVASFLWIRHSTIETKLDLTKLLAQELSDRAVGETGQIMMGPRLPFILEEREKFLNIREPLHIYIKNSNGDILTPHPRRPGPNIEDDEVQLLKSLDLTEQLTVKKVELTNSRTAYAVMSPIKFEKDVIGAVVIFQPINELTNINQEEYQLLALLLISLAILGWLVIYSLSKELAKPIEQVASAAQELMKGNYDVELNDNVQEKELHQLIVSFKEMTQRLKKLETLRTQLLAGVTHELKTPITSVSALIQAVKDDVVSEERKKEFLLMSLKESKRLQSMVEDLLDFNSFSAGSIKVNNEQINVARMLKEIVYQWEIVHLSQLSNINLQVSTMANDLFAVGDAVRIQQIIINLLNNSLHAVKEKEKGEITIELSQETRFVTIEVKDNGYGIAVEEQTFIFERFYRGDNKKHVERGLGLGLPYSLLLAKAQHGNLFLKQSSNGKTVFTFILPIE